MPQQKNKNIEKLQLIGFSTFNLPSVSQFSPFMQDSMKFITTQKNIPTAYKDYLDHEGMHINNNQNDEDDSLALRMNDHQPYTNTTKKKKLGCTCKKTFCLKMYCECFANNKNCNQQCACCDCKNITGNDQVIEQAKGNVKEKGIHNCSPEQKRCNCKKSFCQKKYCQCFNAGVSCSDACKCLDCSNKDLQSSYRPIQKLSQVKIDDPGSRNLLQKSMTDLANL